MISATVLECMRMACGDLTHKKQKTMTGVSEWITLDSACTVITEHVRFRRFHFLM